MEFRVILTFNGKYKKTLHRCSSRETAFINYHQLKENNKVYFPRHYINSDGIKPVKYQICITKVYEEGEEFRVLRDNMGKFYTEEKLGDWIILASDQYQIEETFYMYGYEMKGSERPTITEVVKKLMINAHSKKLTKQVIVVYNKLIIYNEEQFDLVVCKNMLDAQRLHHTLCKIATKQRIKSLMFMGTATKANIGRLYDLIVDKTGWNIKKVRKTSTRP